MKRILLASAALLVLSACATKPDVVEEVVQQRPAAETQAPVFEPAPETLPPVVQQPQVFDVVPDVNLPSPGSIEDFAYQTGGDPRVFFGYDQYDLSVEAKDVLRRQANWLSLYDTATAVVEGHADERGTREYNIALGARRADSVKAFLVSQGVAPNRLRTISYGKERPIDGRPSTEGWARNRNGFTSLRLGRVS